MTFRFQRRIKIAPGVTLNLSKSGVSTSIGRRGARITFGREQTRTTVGVPGTGLSYTSVERNNTAPREGSLASVDAWRWIAFFGIPLALLVLAGLFL